MGTCKFCSNNLQSNNALQVCYKCRDKVICQLCTTSPRHESSCYCKECIEVLHTVRAIRDKFEWKVRPKEDIEKVIALCSEHVDNGGQLPLEDIILKVLPHEKDVIDHPTIIKEEDKDSRTADLTAIFIKEPP